MKTLFLPFKLRTKLKKPFGLTILGNKNQVAKKFQKLLIKKKVKRVITVGDYCSKNLPSQIKIFDGKIKRRNIRMGEKSSLSCFNPPGTIQKEAWSILRMAFKKNKNVFVVGEEDLLAIPAILLAKKGDLVVYGLPNKGIVVLEPSSQFKKKIRKILKSFVTSDLSL
jgi:uncharacterized protein (UPF0218 family)